jgi:hypothetical protein
MAKTVPVKIPGQVLIAKQLDYNYDPNEEILEKA